LGGNEPVSVLWPTLLDIVFHSSPQRAHVDRLSRAARTIYLVVCFDGEVINGGFGQFFENSSGQHAGATLEALRRIGAKLSAELLEKALTAFPGSVVPTDQRQRYELLSEFEAQHPRFLDELDEIYYREVDTIGPGGREDVHNLLVAFMRANTAEPIIAEPVVAADGGREAGF
jgi:hypothetical protein